MDTPLTWHAPTPGLVVMMDSTTATNEPTTTTAPTRALFPTTSHNTVSSPAFGSPIHNTTASQQSTPFVFNKRATARNSGSRHETSEQQQEEAERQQQLNHLWRRTRSLDECSPSNHHHHHPHHCLGEEYPHDGADSGGEADTSAPLHSSFDASLLGDNSNNNHDDIFRSAAKSKRRATYDDHEETCTSLFGPEDDSQDHNACVGRKHLRQQPVCPNTVSKNKHNNSNKDHPQQQQLFQQHQQEDEDYGICPGTVRKLARHNTNETAVTGSKTPVRLLWKEPQSHYGVKKRRTPSNHKRTMPPRRQDAAALTPLATTATTTSGSGAAIYTGTTAASSTLQNTTTGGLIWETSQDDASPSSTPFRFTSFPASLPRVHNYPRVSNASDTVRKRMSFGPEHNSCEQHNNNATPLHPTTSSLQDARSAFYTNHQNNNVTTSATTTNTPFQLNHHHYSHNNNNSSSLNHSREEDSGTQNTSISSLSTHGGGVPVDANGHLLPHQGHHTRLLFQGEEEEYNYSDDDDEEEDHVMEDGVGRTRLDFNLVLAGANNNNKGGGGGITSHHPGGGLMLEKGEQDNMPLGTINMNADLSRPYEARHVNSFPSTSSSHSPLRNLSGCETASTAALTPSGGPSRDPHQLFPNHSHELGGAGSSSGGSGSRPGTPREVQLHFQLDNAQCSPIPGIPEEEELNGGSAQSRRSGKPRLPPKPRPTMMEDVDTAGKGLPPKKPAEFPFALDSASVSSTSSGKRRLRPMPDMAAFDSGALSSSRQERSTLDDSVNCESSSKAKRASSPNLMCPPTPVRTPAWAHIGEEERGGLFHRSNSLIGNRVLATCSPPPFHPDVDEDVPLAGELMEDTEMTNADAPMVQPSSLGDPNDPNQLFEPLPPPKIIQRYGSDKVGAEISFATHFDSLGILGKGAFADVFKVRSKADNRLYAVKRNRRRFRGKRDRDNALVEVRSMQRLQHVDANESCASKKNYVQYLLFFFRAWQEDGHFFCQTELCCRDTCRELMDSLRSQWTVAANKYPSLHRLPPLDKVVPGSSVDLKGRLFPEMTVWKICHDICAGLSHMHARGLVHNDIKPSNIFFVPHGTFGTLCKIGDFGMAGCIGTSEDGQEGDSQYMAPELLSSAAKHSSADIFSLGLTLYEVASCLSFELPKQGPRWHELRSGSHVPDLPSSRDPELKQLVQRMIVPDPSRRPGADAIVKHNKVQLAGSNCDAFLRDYLGDIEEFDRREDEKEAAVEHLDDKTPRHGPPCRFRVCSPSLEVPTVPPNIFTPEA